MQNLKMFKNKIVVMVPLSLLLLKANANTVGYNPDDVKQFENSNPHTCMQCNLADWKMSTSSSFLSGGDYSGTNLSGAILDGSNIFNNLKGQPSKTNVQNSNFSYSIAQNTSIGDSVTIDFSSSNFNNVKYDGVVISGKSFSNSTFKGASIVNSSIRIGTGDYTNFTDADLSNSSISSGVNTCSLYRAIFINANLANTTTSSCDERNVDFTGADLTGASIINGNLCNAKITPQQLASMTSLSGTVGPECTTVYK
ncbi:MAG: hypothetical protein K0R14_206 [Burkholderiales bacterium]|jgi:uncharacterized protein YjbI with pentapeptide repeats|nr:hypothetical protein [Burkholderiales bacterium]